MFILIRNDKERGFCVQLVGRRSLFVHRLDRLGYGILNFERCYSIINKILCLWNGAIKVMRKALVVGINNYPKSPLTGCLNDALAVKELLAKNENGTPNFSVLKKDNINTKGELRSLIEQCFDGDTDVALFYYSGHGYIDSVGGYLVTPDYKDCDWGVSLQDVLNIANHSKCKERIIILDSCFSGFMGNISTDNQNTAVIEEGVTILTASKKNETSTEVDGHGVFTSLLLEALRGGASDILGHITVSGVYAFIDKSLGPWEQRPTFKTNVTRFISLRDVTPQVDINVVRRIGEYFGTDDMHFALDPSFEPTNTPSVSHQIVKPYAISDNTAKFLDLQKLEGVGLVVPVDEEHMYYAAMNSKSCKLTTIGKHYWRLIKNEII